MNITKATLPSMVARKYGEFVSFASVEGITPSLLMGSYHAAKAAVAMLTEVVCHENRDRGVKFASICPPLVTIRLLKQAKEIAWQN